MDVVGSVSSNLIPPYQRDRQIDREWETKTSKATMADAAAFFAKKKKKKAFKFNANLVDAIRFLLFLFGTMVDEMFIQEIFHNVFK